jgi:hypothetical protein
MPSCAGKTIGTDNNDRFLAVFWFDAGSNFNDRTASLGQQSGTFDITQVQLEEGPFATPFERRPIVNELKLCQRYFQKSYQMASPPGTVTQTGQITTQRVSSSPSFNGGLTSVSNLMTMRVAPTITLYNPSSGASNSIRLNGTTDVASGAFTWSYNTSNFTFVNNIGASNVGDYLTAQYTADAEL